MMPRKRTTLGKALRQALSNSGYPPDMRAVRRAIAVCAQHGPHTFDPGRTYPYVQLIREGELILWTTYLGPNSTYKRLHEHTVLVTNLRGHLVVGQTSGTVCPYCSKRTDPASRWAWCWLCGFARRVPPSIAVTYRLLDPNFFPAILDAPRMSAKMRARIRTYFEPTK